MTDKQYEYRVVEKLGSLGVVGSPYYVPHGADPEDTRRSLEAQPGLKQMVGSRWVIQRRFINPWMDAPDVR